jgi:heme exporter protein B
VSYLSLIKAVFVKDIVIELRARQTLPTMAVFGLLIAWIMRIASEGFTGGTGQAAPAALLVALLFSGILAQERAFATEAQNDCIYALLLAPVDPGALYIAKLLSSVLMLCIFEAIVVPIILFGFKATLAGGVFRLIAVLLLCNLAISSVGTIFSAIVQVGRARGSLLAVVTLAILMPVMIPASFALMSLFGVLEGPVTGLGALAFVGSFEAAAGYMAAFDAVFTTAAWLLFGFVLKE